MEAKTMGFTTQEINNGFYKQRDDLAGALEADLGLKLLVDVPTEQFVKFFSEHPGVQKHIGRVSFRVKPRYRRDGTGSCLIGFITIK